ncbi:translation factor [Piedraia hortae CBS 480.64]|uniref:Threonylcarbamoyl-AMP synthase n=1 Tax=Piedraia hortae CBS 480.64 TaxID=1314780 RepID=A0A6A7C4X1_9PEZI|nr:translation factor [Piedraia hortae CBS 480.64]
MKTTTLPVNAHKIGALYPIKHPEDLLSDLGITIDRDSADGQNLLRAAKELRCSDLPVAFPTETVYGLGGDASRPESIKNIFRAKQRPTDNPLIVHVASLQQLRTILSHGQGEVQEDPIPPIYHPLIKQFWPGPLTIILPNPSNSILAPEVTAGLNTFGARMPRHILALALIKLANVPVAAPSANASTKPSPTAAEHVAFDLDGRISTILDGGPCDVGVESTVVDGLSDPPVVLRPGGISIDQLRTCPGWSNVQIGYGNVPVGRPRAPGMKYRHYSPKASVVLYGPGREPPTTEELHRLVPGENGKIGIIRTQRWPTPIYNPQVPTIMHMFIGPDATQIAKCMFGALRQLDQEGVETIVVEGIDDGDGDTSAAVMNRLRKAAELVVPDQP